MDIRVRAALYSIGFFVGIFAVGMVINTAIQYIQPWMWPVFWLVVLFVCVYHLMLAKLKWDDSIDRVTNFPKEDK
jgi:hypothetical protein